VSVAAAAGPLERAALWRLLSLGLAVPDDESLDELGALAGALRERGIAAERLDALAAALADADERARLEAEHHRLFDGDAPCPPNEGGWEADPFRAVRGLADVAGFYGAFGAAARGPAAERADHAGCELEFLAFLGARAAALEAEGDARGAAVCRDAEEAFLRDHAGRWLPAFFAAVLAQTRSAVHACVAALGEAVVREELARRGLEPEPLRPRSALAVEADCLSCGLAAGTAAGAAGGPQAP
jgi:TorA maturation chaperone TorD